MSHESAELGRAVFYVLPARCSDKLRTIQFGQFFEGYRGTPFSVRTRDGWFWSSSVHRAPEFVATFRTREGLDAVISEANEATLGRIFLDGSLDIQGNIFALLSVAEYTLRHSEGLSSSLIQTVGRISLDVCRRIMPGSKGASRQNWHSAPCPLDLPTEFFAPWLGSLLGHSCAFFRDTEENFDSAQRNALEHACYSLELDSGDRLLDVGCGWGSLLVYAAEKFGADVRGITSSESQLEASEAGIRRNGLNWKCSVERRDLRTAPYRADKFDKIAHLGVFEQVVHADLESYLRCMRKMMVPGGLLLLDRLTCARDRGAIARCTHPDLPAEPLSKELETVEGVGLELLSVETLQDEYVQTLRVWIDQLQHNCRYGNMRPFAHGYRAWLFYLVEVAAGLRAEELQVHRVLLRRPRRGG